MRSDTRSVFRSPQLWILVIFLVSRVLYFAAGVRFDARPIANFFQFVDPELLKHRLFESLLYLHTQPPGMNLLAGIVLKLFPVHYSAAFHAVFLACGISLCFTIFRLLRIFEVGSTLAAILTSLFLVSPGVVMFENLLIYEYVLMAVLCASAVILYSLFTKPRMLTAVAFFTGLMLLVYLRALFHLGFIVLIAAALVYLMKGRRRMILTAACIPVLLAVGLYLKNWIVFGTFSGSTWMGFNIATITIGHLTPEEKDAFIRSGLISPVSLLVAGTPLKDYAAYIHPVPLTGIPILDQEYDSTGRTNFNNAAFAQVRVYYMRDGKALLLHYPKCYVRSIVKAWFAYFLPTGDFPFFEQNRPKIGTFDRYWNIVFYGQWRDASDRKNLRRMEGQGSSASLILFTGTYLLLSLPLLFIFGIVQLWRSLRRTGFTPETVVLAFMLFNIAFLTALVNFLSCYENNRYRLPLDPFFVVLLGMALQQLVKPKRVTALSGEGFGVTGGTQLNRSTIPTGTNS